MRSLGTGEYTQRSHLSFETSLELWQDLLGILARISGGYTYSSTDGYLIENGRLVPTAEMGWRAFAGDLYRGSIESDGDVRIGFGKARYIIVGADFSVTLNLSELMRRLSNG